MVKIIDIKCYLVHARWRKNLLFIKVETDEGISGWGESYTQYDRDQTFASHVEELKRYLVGRNPFRIKEFTQIAFDEYAQRRGSLEFYSALSGIEQAMWDVVGKITGQPVYNLLGGACREKIRIYANGWSYGLSSPSDFARAAEKVVAQGFTALKFDPMPKPWRTFVPKEHIESAASILKEIRSAVGKDVDLLIDNHRRLAPMHAVELADRYREHGIFWFEEPCPPHNIEAMKEVRAKVNVPLVVGEAVYTKSEFRPLLEARVADILNPDVANVGGVLELKEISAMAEPHFVAIAPHNYNSTTLALAATVQAAATMPNFLITEYFLPFEQLGRDLTTESLTVENGYIVLPEKPGLGISMNEEKILEYGYRQYPLRTLSNVYEKIPA
ncbi:MAG: mandelate racemase/muconate lactonizing enzyme family protein [Rhizobiaceae bacterium]